MSINPRPDPLDAGEVARKRPSAILKATAMISGWTRVEQFASVPRPRDGDVAARGHAF